MGSLFGPYFIDLKCDHKCHGEPGLNPWVERCPVCGCRNEKHDPDARPPKELEEMSDFLFDPLDGVFGLTGINLFKPIPGRREPTGKVGGLEPGAGCGGDTKGPPPGSQR
jgi:hypothetical protein